jgi:Protein of unknown function, DUF547
VRSKGFQIQFALIAVLAMFTVLVRHAQAASKAVVWPRWQKHDAASEQKIDQGAWDRLLKQYVLSHPSGINRVRYQDFRAEDQKVLKNYLQSLQGIPISSYNRKEQQAYWINLYNALTVELIISRFPVASIRDINISPGLLARGPWGAKLLTVEGENLSLDDIEHRILRPIWQDERIHYAVNCASLGCPNLQPAAYTGENTEALLDKGAREFVNHPRGVALTGGKLKVSSIYVWFQEDFGGDADGLMEHWQTYANPPLAGALEKYKGGLSHDYDWRLNGVDAKP